MNDKKTVSSWLGLIGLALSLACCDCGGSGPATNTTSSDTHVQFSTPALGTSIDQGQSISVSASVSGSNAGVTWSLQTGVGQPVGKLTNESTTAATYVAPNSITQPAQVTIVATSVADPTASAALSINIEPLPQITSASPTPATIGCPASGTVIPEAGSAFGTVWTVGQNSLSYYLSASGGVSPYTWSITSGTLPTGLNLGTPTASQPMIYGSPTAPGCSTVTVQLTDAAGASVTTPYYLIVLPPALLVQPPPLALPQVGVLYPPTSLAAGNGQAPFYWSLDSTTPLPPGLEFGSSPTAPSAASISGTPTAAGLGLSFSPSVLVYDSQLPYPAVAQFGLNITQVASADSSCHGGSEATLTTQDPYAFMLRGFDNVGPVVVVGNFTADGTGKITGGQEDIIRAGGVRTNLSIVASGSSYTIGSDNRGCLTLANSAGATTIFQFALGHCSTSANVSGGCANGGYFTRGHIVENDSSSEIRASGIIRLTDPTAFSNSALTGLYAFGLSGWDAAGGRFAVAGSATAAAGTFASVAADINDAGTTSSSLTGGTGSYVIQASGRGTGAIAVGTTSISLCLYVISSSEAFLASVDPLDATHPVLSGETFSAPGPFKIAALQNSYLLKMAGGSAGAPDPSLGLVTFDGNGGMTGTVYENNAGSSTATSISANYAIDAGSGRLSLWLQAGQNLGAHPFVGYVASASSGIGALLISTDNSAQAGSLEYQNSNPASFKFSNASLSGPSFLGTDENLDASTWDYVGTVSPNGNGGQAGCLCDVSGPGVDVLRNVLFLGNYSIGKTGYGYFGGQSVTVTNVSTTYSIDESPLDIHPSVTVMEQ